ncbi:MAG TPA: tetratricopeptide repeat protein [Candidatus Sulfotelmatobacter sp.]|nr:tetratricopeptide repeat protein [Candidatus Sulfotelmatobacter sp.]
MFGEQEDPVTTERLPYYRLYLRQRPVILVVFTLMAVIFFLFTSGLARLYRAQRESLGTRWFTRGRAELNARNYAGAVSDFRAALLYSRDNYTYQLNLAEALLGLGRTGQASAYLLNLWDREPEDGLVNLELARIASSTGQLQQAIRYYHDAIYAAWASDEEWKRRDARLELIELLLNHKAPAQAQSELIGLEANVGDDPAQQEQIGSLFLRAQDYEHALNAFVIALKSERHNPTALAGAGEAAFQLGRYPLAQRYLQAALAANPNDKQSAQALKTTEMVVEMDPFRRQISTAERNRSVVQVFQIAGQRLTGCALPKSTTPGPASTQPSLSDEWASLKPKITERNLERDPDLVESAMDLVFQIERQTSIVCGTPSGSDLALLLIAKLHEGNQ